MRYSAGIIALLTVLVVPGAVGGLTPTSDVRNYALHVFEGDSTTNGGVVTDTFTFTIPHGYDVSERFSWFAIDANYLLEGGVGTRVREFTFESDAGHQCNWRVSIGSNLQALNSYRHMECTGAPIDSGTHTFWINSTAIDGSNPIVWSGYSIILHQHEEVTMATAFETTTGLTAVEFLIFPALAFLGFFLWSRLDYGLRFFGVFLVLFDWALVFAFYASASGQAWAGLLVLLVALLPVAGWMAVRVFLDIADERNKKEAT